MKTLTIADLLVKPQSLSLSMGDRTLKLWVRPLSTTERELCQATARGVSRRLQRELEDPKTENHRLLIADELEVFNKGQLQELWVNAHLLDRAIKINVKSLEDRDQTFVPEPEGENVTVSEINAYENTIDDNEESRETNVNAAVNAARKLLQEEVKTITLKELKSSAAPNLIEQIVSQEWQREYSVAMLARGTFLDQDCQKPAFKTNEQVKMLRPDALEQLTSAHYGLILEPEALKVSGDESLS